MILEPNGKRRIPSCEREREALLGFERDHTLNATSSSIAKSRPAHAYSLRMSMLGDSFYCKTVAWILSHLFVKLEWLVRIPSPEGIRSGAVKFLRNVVHPPLS